MNTNYDYFEFADIAVTVIDKDGRIMDMNEMAKKTYVRPGGSSLIGDNALDYHPAPAKSILEDMLANPRTNIYTLEKDGTKKLIFQCPWYYEDRRYAGYIEVAIVLPGVILNRVK